MVKGVEKLKKIFYLLIAGFFLLGLVGCVEYLPKEEKKTLVEEIAEIEKGILNISKETENITVEAEVPEKEIKKEIEKTLEKEISIGPEINKSELQRIEVKETQLVKLKVKAEDLDKDIISFTYSSPLNEKGEWQTKYGDAGEYIVTVTASDNQSTTKKHLLLVVKKLNVAPEISEIPPLTVKEGDLVVISPNITDLNKDEVKVTFSLPLENGKWQTDFKSAGEYNITITAFDGELETKKTVLVKVIDINVPPEIKGLAEEIRISEGENVTIKPEIFDFDGDKVNLTISQPVGDDGFWQTSYTDHGEYKIIVAADDGKENGQVSRIVKLIVEDINVPPEIIEVTLGE